jgi:hypothetical protein
VTLSRVIASASFRPALEIRSTLRLPAAARTRLLACEDGWSLVGPNGELIFRGLGRRGRRQCLEAARERGIPVVFS